MRQIGWLFLLFVPMAASAVPAPQLNQHQTILDAHRVLLSAGWQPAPEALPSPGERHWSGVSLNSLSTCSGTGAGFCRFDYKRNRERLSVVTVPSKPGKASVGRVARWW
ncbi:MAG: hypothetical protein O2972_08845 [Cyanobacteria bacterium]|nr:hypothetical protein [Synechococcus sp. BS307-5m-G38]MDA0258779.1 hypothetical protein [Cyanobacteriota bacterium]